MKEREIFLVAYQEAEIESNDNIICNGDGSKFKITQMTSKSYSDDGHRVGGKAAKD